MEPTLFIENGPAAIIAASVITYAFRLGGLLLADRLPSAGPLRHFLDALPGTILVSLVVPSALHAGWQGMVGVGACLLVYLRMKNLLVIMVTGILTVYLLRLLG